MNVMKRFTWLLWKHRRALATFERAKRSLEKVVQQFHAEAEASDKRVAEYQSRISEEGFARSFINSQRETITKQIGAIDKILQPE